MTQILAIGIVVLDDILPIPAPLVPGAKHRATGIDTVVGGNAANAALAVARLGGTARLIARIGDDEAGQNLLGRLAASGIDTSLSRVIAGSATSRSAVIIEPGGARTIINHLDPNLPDSPDWLPDALPAGIRGVLGDTRWETGARRLFQRARAAGIAAVFDGDRKPVDSDLVGLATHAIFSEQGLAELAGTEDPGEGLRHIGSHSDAFVAVTAGGDGVYSFEQGAIRHHPAFQVEAVDTLGAGDVWHGAFALALGEGMTNDRAIRFASAVAAIKCTRRGGSTGSPRRDEVERFLEQHPQARDG